jgi:hypothetical protein
MNEPLYCASRAVATSALNVDKEYYPAECVEKHTPLELGVIRARAEAKMMPA